MVHWLEARSSWVFTNFCMLLSFLISLKIDISSELRFFFWGGTFPKNNLIKSQA
jgi:hypothetical protein